MPSPAASVHSKKRGTTFLLALLETGNLRLAVLVMHAAVDLGDLAGVAQTSEPAPQEFERVPVLGENDELLARVLLS
jgi:hypothetical protein